MHFKAAWSSPGSSKSGAAASRFGRLLSTNHVGAMDMRRAMPHFKKAEAFLSTQPESHRQ
jgi:hypothetical protein